MAWTATNPVSVGDRTKKQHYDTLWDNVDYLHDDILGVDGSDVTFPGNVTVTEDITTDNVTISDDYIDITGTADAPLRLESTDGTCGINISDDTTTSSRAMNRIGNDLILVPVAGNVGIGVTPESWVSTYNALQIGAQGSISSLGTASTAPQLKINTNTYHDSVNDRQEYISSGEATEIFFYNGTMYFRTAVSGDADDPITWKTAMYIDNDGAVTKPYQPAFLASLETSLTNVTGSGTNYTVIYDTERYDLGANYALATGVFTAPVDGVYRFTAQITASGGSADETSIVARINTSNGNCYSRHIAQYDTAGSTRVILMDFEIYLDANDTMSSVQIAVSGGDTDTSDLIGSTILYNYMCGHLVC